ncbi:MAG: heparan-alpha-glucosaminide N-acetyltransferase domain-containing protein, partial [Planctomycetota bacterium]
MQEPAAGTSRRETGLDLARGLAVAGMAIVNFDLALAGDGGPSWLATLVESVQGRASALFVVLAGVGIGILSQRRGTTARSTIARRGIALFVGGLALLAVWPADILHFYGLWFVLVVPLLGRSRRTLLALAAFLVALFPALVLLGVDYERHWDFEALEYEGVLTADGFVRHLTFNGFHPTIPWFAYLLAGLALSDLLTDRRVSVLALAALTGAIAMATEWLSPRLVASVVPEAGPLLDTSSIPPGPPYVIAGGATAISVLALCIHIGRRPRRWRVLRAVEECVCAAGRCALSLYVLHVLVGIVP